MKPRDSSSARRRFGWSLKPALVEGAAEHIISVGWACLAAGVVAVAMWAAYAAF